MLSVLSVTWPVEGAIVAASKSTAVAWSIMIVQHFEGSLVYTIFLVFGVHSEAAIPVISLPWRLIRCKLLLILIASWWWRWLSYVHHCWINWSICRIRWICWICGRVLWQILARVSEAGMPNWIARQLPSIRIVRSKRRVNSRIWIWCLWS